MQKTCTTVPHKEGGTGTGRAGDLGSRSAIPPGGWKTRRVSAERLEEQQAAEGKGKGSPAEGAAQGCRVGEHRWKHGRDSRGSS